MRRFYSATNATDHFDRTDYSGKNARTMAIDIHGLNFLQLAAKETGFGRTATIGRQSLPVPKETIRRLLNLEAARDFGPFCEDLLKAHFGSTIVDSWDYSDFEGANCIADLNKIGRE